MAFMVHLAGDAIPTETTTPAVQVCVVVAQQNRGWWRYKKIKAHVATLYGVATWIAANVAVTMKLSTSAND